VSAAWTGTGLEPIEESLVSKLAEDLEQTDLIGLGGNAGRGGTHCRLEPIEESLVLKLEDSRAD
jgi:hypothetical protein